MLPGYQLPNRTRMWCGILKWFTVLVAFVFIALFFTQSGANALTDHYWKILPPDIRSAVVYSDLKKTLLKLVGIIAWFGDVFILLGIYRTLNALQKGDPFALPVVKSIRFLGLMIIVAVIIEIATRPVTIAIMTFDGISRLPMLSISAGSDEAVMLILGTLFLILGQIFTQAVLISDENRQIV